MNPFLMLQRSCGALVLTLTVLGLGATPALAQGGTDSVEPEAITTGYDHVSPPPPGAFSTADWCFRFPFEVEEGLLVQIEVVSPSGETLLGEGVVDGDGGVKVLVGITEGGNYTVTGVALSDGRDVFYSPAEIELNVVFDPEQVDCLASLPPRAAAQPTPTPTPTATPEPAATATPIPTEVPTAAAEPTAEPTAAPTAAPTTAPTGGDDDGDGGSTLPWILVGIGGVIITGGGLFLLAKPKGDCSREKADWDAAEASFQEAVDAVGDAEETLDNAIDARKRAAQELARAKRDVAPDPGGDSVTDEATGETITSRDRWLRDRYAAAEWDAYRSNPNPETARAYEEAMRQADTPEARDARRGTDDQARSRAQQAQAALDNARQAEREAESALERRHRDVRSERKLADDAKKRYEDCIKDKAEFDRRAEEGRKRYEDAIERDRKRRSGGDGAGEGGGTAIATPPAVEINGPCSPIGSTDVATTRVTGPAIADNDTVTITILRSHGTWENDELAETTTDAFLRHFGGAGTGAGDRTAVFTMPAARAAGLDAASLLRGFEMRQEQLKEDWDATSSRRLMVTFSWFEERVDATCTKTVRCTGNGWLSTGRGTFTPSSGPVMAGQREVAYGDNDPTADVIRIVRHLQALVTKRKEVLDLMEACARP